MATTTKKSTAKKAPAKPRAAKTAATNAERKAPEGMVWSERFQEFVPYGSMRARPR